ncbi:acyl carrier protein [Nocardioides sp. YR527]|uniref:phosphopantetheine-binding protein n=1 Tax=Nocardioides sp. YR527 TaxID=1881028 RepID=UPI00087E7318|nr:phosphopantetheine-binding protein [Nocardioides sp. YR527]SDK96505.1 acyl carrier protein [Nocardioides sp. YR527]
MTIDTTDATLVSVAEAITEVIGPDHSAGTLAADTLLFGSLPELDSLALVELITVLEDRFGFEMDEDDINAEVFESVGSLADHVRAQVG